jgi:hypothetical protein
MLATLNEMRAAMTLTQRRPDVHPNRRRHPAVLALLGLLIGGALIAGCGSSSKPAYCDPVAKTENAVKSLPTVQDVKKNGVDTLKSALSTLEQNATNAINQAKSDFSSQTTALKNSVDSLSSAVKQLTSSPSAATLAQLPAELSAVRKAAKWQQIAIEAIKQCGSPWLPVIEPPVTPQTFLDRHEPFDLLLVASLQPGSKHAREFFDRFTLRSQHSQRGRYLRICRSRIK